MSTTINQIRSIVQDKPQHVQDTIEFNGALKLFRLSYYPLVSGLTLSSNPQPDSIDLETGIISFITAPDTATVTADYDTVILSDLSIQDLIDVETSLQPDGVTDIRLMAAAAADAIASNQAIILKRIKLLDLDIDGTVIAKAFRDQADNLRKLVFDPKYTEASIDFAEQINDIFGYREKIVKDFMRGSF